MCVNPYWIKDNNNNTKKIAKMLYYSSRDCCTYYECPHCQKEFDNWQTYRNKDESHCPECGKEIELAKF